MLASVVAPPQGYAREELGSYNAFTPLNRLVDAVPPESDTAREFQDIAAKIAAGNATPQELQKAREWLTLWRDNDARLEPMLPLSDLTKELVPVSKNLSQVAEIGLQALDSLQNNRPLSADMRQKNIALLQAAEKPRAVLVIAVVPSIELLVRATKSE